MVGDSESRRGEGLDDDDLSSVCDDGADEAVLACLTVDGGINQGAGWNVPSGMM